MLFIKRKLKALVREEAGAEVMEYALIAGLIVAGCIAILGKFGGRVLARWSSVNSSL